MSPTRTQLADPRTLRRATAGRRMNRSEAQALTAQIRSTATGLWRLVAEAYDRKAWQAMGYSGWKEYAELELQMSESRSYQLVDTGRVMRAIGEVVGSEEVFETIVVTARETAKVKPHLSSFKKELSEYVKDGVDPVEAVEMAIENLPTTEKKQRGPRVIDGEIVATHPDEDHAEPDLPQLVISGSAGSGKSSAVVAPLFSAAEGAPEAWTPKTVPAGKKVCKSCRGHGYV